MIHIKSVSIRGVAEGLPFRGHIDLKPGIHVITGENDYGKTLISTSIAWCLGLEPMYGVRPGDNAIFSSGVRERIELHEDQTSRVDESHAEVEFSNHLGRTYRLRRSIIGGKTNYIAVAERTGTNFGPERNLLVGLGSLSSEASGFQHWLFQTAGLPLAEVMTNKGASSPIYVENLGPLFFIEQTEGWSDLQSLQIYRYGQIAINEAAVEYLLGLDTRLKQRFAKQSSESQSGEIRQDAIRILERTNEFIRSNGWDETLPTKLSLETIGERLKSLKLSDYLRERFHWSPAEEHKQLTLKADQLRSALNKDQTASQTTAPVAAASSRAIQLKESIHKKKQSLNTLRQQLLAQEELFQTTGGRIASAKDLLRLKQDNIGFPQHAECPTCLRDLNIEELELDNQGLETIERHITTLEKDRDALKTSLAATRTEVERTVRELERAEQEFFAAERSLELINSAAGPQREAIVGTAIQIIDIERAIEKNRKAANELLDLQKQIDDWNKIFSAFSRALEGGGSEEDAAKEAAFVSTFKSMLLDLGYAKLSKASVKAVRLDEHYTPYLEHRRLRSIGSGSDRARLISAFSVALWQTSLNNGGHHPGLLLWDEPLQQNPDDIHRVNFCEALLRLSRKVKLGQLLIITHLRKEEMERLNKSGINLTALPAHERFLKSVSSP
ncbi:AAA family ATPase [Corallococcus exercitus]|uniref:AAA family ATPase n=1 Tax=Corallococcus exercitus TaxID=2316736 RepID=UPI0035D4A85C